MTSSMFQRRVVLYVGKQADDVYTTPVIILVIITMTLSPPRCPLLADICDKVMWHKTVKFYFQMYR